MKLLIVEDETELVSSLLSFSRKEKYLADVARNYREAKERVSLYEYDCILLDINLPDGSGLELLEYLKTISRSNGVIITSARDSLDDRIKGLDLGADDYLTKPFHFSELNSRIQAIIRRSKFGSSSLLAFNNLKIDINLRTVMIDTSELGLTKKEFEILQHLTANKNRIISKNALAEYIWGDHIDSVDSFDFLFQHLKNLKRKLKAAGALLEIKSIYGVGYQLIGS
ncbi:response regulator transcription factor [Pedobacter fastidiosus]|uniref:Response regulator transcription factor n=1 Tax=Pedobacter fastidiosus TaxID=2765361 RepID=A0ABR7KWH3_9SPHI|nr:response regulator transcription factor [Pedobacter fastidiosus]MBC6112458.1 response regulator transcription factor [Pedobacter fastidiosus]